VDGTARRARLARSRLYFVLEARPHGGDPSDLLDAALRGGVDVVQLRDKDLPASTSTRSSWNVHQVEPGAPSFTRRAV